MSKTIKTSGNYMVYRDGARVAGFALEDDRNLFQSAPELLEALEEVLELAGQPHSCCYERMDDDDPCEAEGYGDGNREEHKVLERAKQAIAKAKGTVNDDSLLSAV